ncbi:hypothetical protein NY08_2955 [Rhodococcus sp. B7740]|nr:hypothetical protein NY08_2955 [Rhodococcus sp. B7740]
MCEPIATGPRFVPVILCTIRECDLQSVSCSRKGVRTRFDRRVRPIQFIWRS